jgi:hypothetical protein
MPRTWDRSRFAPWLLRELVQVHEEPTSRLFPERERDKPRVALNNITAGVREPSEWSGGLSDIEGKTTRVGASECGQRTSFNRTREAGHLDEIPVSWQTR